MSKSLGTKIRDYVADGDLDWVMNETEKTTDKQFDEEWRAWLLSHALEFSDAVEVYGEDLDRQVQRTEIHLGLRASYMPPKVPYGPSHQPFIESIFSRDPELLKVRRTFESALNEGEIAEARGLSGLVGDALVNRIAI